MFGTGGFVAPISIVLLFGKSILSYTSVASLGGPAVGLIGASYFIYKWWNTTAANMTLK